MHTPIKGSGKWALWILAAVFLTGMATSACAETMGIPVKQASASGSAENADPLFSQAAFGNSVGNPFAEMEQAMQNLHRMVQRSVMTNPFGSPASMQGNIVSSQTDMQDLGNQYQIRVDLPGMEKDKINVSISDNSITVSSEKKYEKAGQQDNGMQWAERSFGSFQRMFPIPDNVKTDQITARYENGALMITLPKIRPTPAVSSAEKLIPIQ